MVLDHERRVLEPLGVKGFKIQVPGLASAGAAFGSIV
jgi:hypothetical protein